MSSMKKMKLMVNFWMAHCDKVLFGEMSLMHIALWVQSPSAQGCDHSMQSLKENWDKGVPSQGTNAVLLL